MARKPKPKLIPLRELRALCKEAGVKVEEKDTVLCDWCIMYEGAVMLWLWKDTKKHRLLLKAFCIGLIAMRKAGEI